MFAGLDVSFKQTAVCVVDEAGSIAWGGDTHPEALAAALQQWRNGSLTHVRPTIHSNLCENSFRSA
jgi:hypothetical protein